MEMIRLGMATMAKRMEFSFVRSSVLWVIVDANALKGIA